MQSILKDLRNNSTLDILASSHEREREKEREREREI